MSTRTPAAFLGHGSPMNTLADNDYTRAWRSFGKAVGRPRAALVISAHWFIGATAVTAMPNPRTIHDFFGFPERLFEIQYPAPGAPDVAAEIAEEVKPRWVGLDRDSWGLDHGTWSVLRHVFPEADVPVVQLSINALHSFEQHLDLARRLRPLRRRGLAIIGSGNVVHNLRRVDRTQTGGFDWARRFDEAAREIVIDRPDDVLSRCEHPDYARAVPTPDHFIPLLYLTALAEDAESRPEVLVDGYAWGSLSMTSYTLDARCESVSAGASAALGASTVPPDETNT